MGKKVVGKPCYEATGPNEKCEPSLAMTYLSGSQASLGDESFYLLRNIK